LESVKYSPNGRQILTGEGWPLFTATLWDAQSGEQLRNFAGHKWVVSALGFNARGTSILTGAELVREWSIADVVTGLLIERKPELRVSWVMGELQHAPAPTGPWQTISNAMSPFLVDRESANGFFRTLVEDDPGQEAESSFWKPF